MKTKGNVLVFSSPSHMWSFFNHTFYFNDDYLIDCPCGQRILTLFRVGESSKIVICPRCNSWHSVLFK